MSSAGTTAEVARVIGAFTDTTVPNRNKGDLSAEISLHRHRAHLKQPNCVSRLLRSIEPRVGTSGLIKKFPPHTGCLHAVLGQGCVWIDCVPRKRGSNGDGGKTPSLSSRCRKGAFCSGGRLVLAMLRVMVSYLCRF